MIATLSHKSKSPLVVGVADCQTAKIPCPALITYALGSCIALIAYDPVVSAGGLLHFMLPDSSLDPDKAAANPYLFADTGIPLLLRQLSLLGAQKSRLRICVAGGAQIMAESSMFHIGKRNYLALRKILWKSGVMVQAEAIGGDTSRTVSLDLNSGAVSLRIPGEPDTLLLSPAKRINL